MTRILTMILAIMPLLALAQPTRIKDLPASGTLLNTTTFPIDDATYGTRGLRMSNFVTMVTSIAATNPATPVAGVLYGVQVVDTAAALTNLNTIYYTNAITMGRNSKGDSGGGRWYFVSNANSAHVNNGTVWRNAANNGNWYWDLSQTANTIPLALFPGVLNSGGTEIDDGFHAALAFCGAPTYGPITASTTNRYQLALPPGEFVVNSVTNRYGVNVIAGDFSALARIGGKTPTLLRHKVPATGHLYTMAGYSATIKGVSFRGMQEANAQGKVAITAVASRTSFSVTAPNLPTIANGTTSFAFFYASTGEYLGSAIVSTAVGTTVTLVTGSDTYATPGGSLTTSMLVSFTRNVTTFFQDGTEITQPSPASRGWAAIVLSHDTNGPGYTQPMVVEDCIIHNFHTGIIRANTIQPIVRHTKITTCNFSGIAQLYIGYGSDGLFESTDIQGGYAADVYTSDNASGYSDQRWRHTAYSVWGCGTTDRWNHMLIETCVNGIYNLSSYVSIANTLIDNFARYGYQLSAGISTRISSQLFLVRDATDTNSALFKVTAADGAITLNVDGFSASQVSGNQVVYGFDLSGGSGDVTVNSVGDLSGIVQWRQTNNAAIAFPEITQIARDSKIQDQMYQGLYSQSQYGMGVKVNNRNRAFWWNDGQMLFGDDPTYSYIVGAVFKTSRIKIGADADFEGVYGNDITINEDKSATMLAPTHKDSQTYNSTNHFAFISAHGQTNQNIVTLGGNVNDLAATRVNIGTVTNANQIYAATDVQLTVVSNAVHTMQGFGNNIVLDGQTNRTALITDHIIVMTAPTAVGDLILPALASINPGREFVVVNENTTDLRIQPAFTTGSGYTVSNLAGGQTIWLQYDGTGYRRIATAGN